MRFWVRLLLALVFMLALFLGIGVWHVTLAILAMIFVTPVVAAAVCYWHKPFVLAVCAALVAIYWVDAASYSYFKAPRSSYKVDQTLYSLKWDKGRLLAFRFENWAPPVSAGTVDEAPVKEDWKAWSGYYPPALDFRFSGFEVAQGKYLAPFSDETGKQHVFHYSMMGAPAWLVIWFLMAPPLLRLYFWRPWFGHWSGAAQTTESPKQHEEEYDWAKSPEALGFVGITYLAAICIVTSLSLFLTGLLIDSVRLSLSESPTPIPLSISVWTYCLAIFTAFATLFVAYPIQYTPARLISIWRYALICHASLAFACDFLCSRFWPGSASVDLFDSQILLMRLGVSFGLLISVILPSLNWKWATPELLRVANVVAAILSCLMGGLTFLIDFRMLEPSLRVVLFTGLCFAGFAYLVAQVMYLSKQKSRTSIEVKLSYAAWLIAVGCWISSCLFDGFPGAAATASQLAQCVWELRLLILLGLNGVVVHVLSRPHVWTDMNNLQGNYRIEA